MAKGSILSYVPLFYIFKTRLLNYRGVVGYLLLDFVPIASVIFFVLGNNASITTALILICSYLGNLSIYEIGYFHNDHSETKDEEGGNRAKYLPVNNKLFILSHIIFFSLISSLLFFISGEIILSQYLLSNLVVFLVFISHTLLAIYLHKNIRLITFPLLVLIKHSPLIIPFFGISEGISLLIWLFAFGGIPRYLNYFSRKAGSIKIKKVISGNENLIRILWLTPFSFLIIFSSILPDKIKLLWLIYLLSSLFLFVSKFSRKILGNLVSSA